LKLFESLKKDVKLYFEIYGGKKALLYNSNVVIAFFLSLISYNLYTKDWYDLPIGMIPDVLGFTLGGYAILLSFGGEKFTRVLTIRIPGEKRPTPFMEFNGAFVHFIVVQVITLIYALVSKSFGTNSFLFSMFGVFLLYYTLLTALSAVFAIMNLSKGLEDMNNECPPKNEQKLDN